MASLANFNVVEGQLVPNFPPRVYSHQDRKEIVEKIRALTSDPSHEVIFFEFHKEENLYYFVHENKSISLSKEDAATKKVQNSVKNFFSEAYNPLLYPLSPCNFTIIDGVYERIRTTSKSVHDTREFHSKVPHQTECYLGRFGCSIDSDFLRDTFDNLTGERPNW